MILAITNTNEKLIREICAKYGYDEIEVYTGIRNLQDFAIRELQNLSSFKYLILDITDLKEKEETIIKSVVAIKSMHNIRIIVMATGYKEGDNLLARLFKEGIYNFVIGDSYQKQDEEFKKCLSAEGNEYKDAIRFRVEENISNNKNKVIIKKEYKKLKQLLTVAIAGTEKHIGTTTQCLLLCKFFNERGLKSCYVCANSGTTIEELRENLGKQLNNGMFQYSGIDIYDKNEKISAMAYGYDVYIYDYGVLTDNNFDLFIKNDKRIIVGGSKLWEMLNIFRSIARLKKLEDVFYIISHCPDDDKNALTTNMGIYKKKTFFSEYAPNPFETNKNSEIYQTIFKDNIEEKTNNLITVEKTNILNFFKRKK